MSTILSNFIFFFSSEVSKLLLLPEYVHTVRTLFQVCLCADLVSCPLSPSAVPPTPLPRTWFKMSSSSSFPAVCIVFLASILISIISVMKTTINKSKGD